MKYYSCLDKDIKKYKGQKVFRGDVVTADIYFSKGKDVRECELLRKYKRDEWYAWDIKGHREVRISTDMIENIVMDSFYHKRRENPEKHKFYWELRDTDDIS